MLFERTPQFRRELKALSKRWPSLPDDLEKAQQVIEALFQDYAEPSSAELRKSFFNGRRAAILSQDGRSEVVKMRLDCASLGSKDVLRCVFAFDIDTGSATLVELYSKTDRPREDTARWRQAVAKPPETEDPPQSRHTSPQ